MFNNEMSYPFASRRRALYARRGIVGSTHPVVSEAGLYILRKGGNAIDAAVAMAITLACVEPTANGIGGDNFAIVWHNGKIHGLNSSGPAPKALNIDVLEKKGHKHMPMSGWESVTVPGAPAGWAALSERFGCLPYEELFKPALEAAIYGVALTADVGIGIKRAADTYRQLLSDELFKPFADTFLSEGIPYNIGDIIKLPNHAAALRSVADTRSESFYRGEICEAIIEFSKQTGGYFDTDDFSSFKPQWVTPLSVNYRGYDVWEIPPNGQGICALLALNILKGYDFSPDSFGKARTLHLQIEAMKLAFADAAKHVSDLEFMKFSTEDLLSDAYAADRRKSIKDYAIKPFSGVPQSGGTVYFATADDDGNMVSMIQSNYSGFGSGLVVPKWGIALHNRAANFSFEKNHVNALTGGKRPYHTIIPGFLTKDNLPIGPFGVMGGFMQPQGHVQVVMNTIDFQMNPQAVLDAPRFCWKEDKMVDIENTIPPDVLVDLSMRGHELTLINPDVVNPFGRGQIIWKTNAGTLCGGTEPRGDGCMYGY
ncbi:MAG: gamma-glutamyltransferase family protein [Oscillospiraceae bacterium]|jgi:gamma-glutamyltranspeptidase/glutathione hydrolase|nr:gamma-glutamyltransferase family protein [Oscillospiraceae bacterium]